MPETLIQKTLKLALREIGAVVALGILAAGLLTFMFVADEMAEGDTHALDRMILTALREPGDLSDPIGPPWFEQSVADITALGGYAVLPIIVGAVAIFLLVSRKPGAALLVTGAVASGGVLSDLLKVGFGRPRPDLVAHLAETSSPSFPSGHAMLSAVTYLTLGVLLARTHSRKRGRILILAYAVALTLMIGASRVYLGVHWPTDVLAGWALGAAWAALWWLAAWWLQRRGKVEAPGEAAG